MQHQAISDELREQAAMYSLGLLEPELSGVFERHVAACAVCRAEVRAFDEAASQLALDDEIEPPASLRARVLASIQDSADAISIVRAHEGAWVRTPFPGVSVKPLYVDPQSKLVTQLVRLAPGAYIPAHRHAAPEQCYVVEGDVRIGDDVFSPGDFSIASTKSMHGRVSSVQGCILVIVGSPENEVYA
jgi:anti-sigma factor ChrR (cupin superfamily)